MINILNFIQNIILKKALILILFISIQLVSAEESTEPTEPTQPVLAFDLIDKAVKDKVISKEEGIIYKVFALHGDNRLPSQYSGSLGHDLLTGQIRSIKNNWNNYSKEMQNILRPFLIPPSSSDSWYFLPSINSTNKTTSTSTKTTATPIKSFFIDIKYNFRIWWYSNTPNGEALANSLKTQIESSLWKKIFDVMNVKLLSDMGYPGNGGTPATDIYLLALVLNDDNSNNVGGAAIEFDESGKNPTPSYVQVNASQFSLSDLSKMHAVIAHEFMHVAQNTFKRSMSYEDALWLYDGMADWFADFAYPAVKLAQSAFGYYLKSMQLPINDQTMAKRWYATSAFFIYLTEKGGYQPSVMRKIFSNFSENDDLISVDKALKNEFNEGFKSLWGSFLIESLNKRSTDYLSKIGFIRGALPVDRHSENVTVPAGSGEIVYNLDKKINYLAGNLYHFVFNDDKARLVTIYNGTHYELKKEHYVDETNPSVEDYYYSFTNIEDANYASKVTFLAYVKIAGKWSIHFPNSTKYFCRDLKKERIEEMYIIVGSSEPKKEFEFKPKGLYPQVRVSNIGCYGWQGNVTVTQDIEGNPIKSTFTSSVTWIRKWTGYTDSPLHFVVKTANVNWSLSGQDSHCTMKGSGNWTISGLSGIGNGLAFPLDSLKGTNHRTGYGMAGGVSPMYEERCNHNGENVVAMVPFAGTWFDTYGFGTESGEQLKLQPSGDVFSSSFDNDGIRTSFSFQAYREE
ncbi:MAG: hypothetical protein HQK49_22890 [Oligoflexia bacterium]|nr:hypothetical protein [Oligoflexia bacterium]